METKRLNEAVKRNARRFEGADFMFRLTKEESETIRSRSQIATLNEYSETKEMDDDDGPRSRSQIATLNKRGTNVKYLPYAFTELGVAMLSSVLKSEVSISVNREIMRAFVSLRRLLSFPDTSDRLTRIEAEIRSMKAEMDENLADQNDINEETRAQLDAISEALAEMQSKEPPARPRRRIGFIQD